MASLEVVVAKIDWAYKHLESLKAELQRYRDDRPCEIVGDCNSDGDRLVINFRQSKPIPVEIPFLIGDCLQNLRSALDYLVWELVLSSNHIPNRKHQFPICNEANGFKSECGKGRLDGISRGAIAEIEALQPYHNGELSENPLFVVNELSNFNKHRRPVLTVLSPAEGWTEFATFSGIDIQPFRAVGYQATQIAVGPRVSLGE